MRAPTRLLAVAWVLVAAANAWSALAGAGGPLDPAREPHEPIDIMSDAQLVLPDALSGNGVRSGTGTSADPFRISGWDIGAHAGPAVRIADVTLYVVVADVAITGNHRHAGLVVERSPNILLERLTVSATRHGVVATEAGLVVRESAFQDIQGADATPPYESHTGIAATLGRLAVEESRFERLTAGIGALNADVSVRATDLLQVERGIASLGTSSDPAGSLALQDVRLQGVAAALDPCGPAAMANPPRPGVFIDPNHVSQARLEGVDVRDFDVGVWVQWSFETMPAAAPVDVSSSLIAHNGQGISFSAGTATLRVRDSTLRANEVGVLAALSLGTQMNAVVLTGNRIESNGQGLWFYHEPAPMGTTLEDPSPAAGGTPQVEVRENDLVENCSFGLRYDPANAPPTAAGYQVPATDNYWGTDPPRTGDGPNDVSPGVVVEPVAVRPFTAEQAPGGLRGAPSALALGPLLAVLFALAILQARRRA